MARRFQRALSPEEIRRRRWIAAGIGCGSAVVLALLIVLILFAKALGGPALPREVRARAASATTATGSGPGAGTTASPAPGGAVTGGSTGYGSAPPLKQQMQYVESAVRSGQRVPVTLTIPDSELNQVMAESLVGRQDVRSAQAYFSKDRVYVVLGVTWQGKDLNLTVTAAPVLLNGGLSFGVEAVRVGSLPAPAAAVARIQKALNERQDRWTPQKTGVYFESVDIREGQAILTGQTVGR